MTEHLPILNQYREICEKDPEGFISQVGKFPSIRMILVEVYRWMVTNEKCLPIEQLSHAEKKELWEQARKVSAVQERNYVIDVCRALHAFGEYLKMSSNVHP